jgi:ascorbate-specific PTS system EIIC-type component UlaA
MSRCDYLRAYKDTRANDKAWKVGGLKTMLGILIREYGATKVKQSVDEIIQDSKGRYGVL